MENGEKNHHFWEISRGGIGTKKSGTGTSTQCSVSVQCYYFGHNLVISYPICVIQVAG